MTAPLRCPRMKRIAGMDLFAPLANFGTQAWGCSACRLKSWDAHRAVHGPCLRTVGPGVSAIVRDDDLALIERADRGRRQ